MTPDLREATAEDARHLATLCHEIQDWHAATYPGRFHPNIDLTALTNFFANLISDPDALIWVCKENDHPIGYLFARIESRPANLFRPANTRMMIEQIGTAAAYRKQGIGRALISAARSHAQRAGCTHLSLTTYDANTTARAFFQSMGLSTTVHHMSADLTG